MQVLVSMGGLESPYAGGAGGSYGGEEVGPQWGGFEWVARAAEYTVGGESRGAKSAVEPLLGRLVGEGG